MAPTVKNLFANLPACVDGETCITLFESAATKVERIVSHSHSSPEGFWYDQADDEWVIVLRGSATVVFEDDQRVDLEQGDYLTIAKHVKHRVASTSAQTIWLAVHVK